MERIAVFVDEQYSDAGKVRVWATRAQGSYVFVPEDPHDVYAALLRQLRCSGVLHAVARIPGLAASRAERAAGMLRRDCAMIQITDRVVCFGDASRLTTLVGDKSLERFW